MNPIDLVTAPSDSDVVAAVRAGARLRRRGPGTRRGEPGARCVGGRGRGTGGRAYASLADFYEHPVRAASREQDFGLWWVAADGSTYRVAWIVETGELYAAEHLQPDGRGGRVEVLARLQERAVERVLEGWQSVCGRPGSYEWLRGRSAR